MWVFGVGFCVFSIGECRTLLVLWWVLLRRLCTLCSLCLGFGSVAGFVWVGRGVAFLGIVLRLVVCVSRRRLVSLWVLLWWLVFGLVLGRRLLFVWVFWVRIGLLLVAVRVVLCFRWMNALLVRVMCRGCWRTLWWRVVCRVLCFLVVMRADTRNVAELRLGRRRDPDEMV